MIQRIQSVYLLLAVVVIIICFFIPLLSIQIPATDFTVEAINQKVFPYGIYNEGILELNTWGIFVILIIACLLPFITIFLYKNRRIQMNLIIISIISILFYFFTVYIYISSIYNELNNATVLNIGTYLPIVSIIFLILAYNNINKDEKKVRSLNRIR